MSSFSKLCSSLVTSTIWRESKETKIVWITILAIKDRHGFVASSLPGLADMAKVSLEECKAALEVLKSPDQYSRTKDFEGRRIDEVEGGWLVLNHDKYREKVDEDSRREYWREHKRKLRMASKHSKCPQLSGTVQDSPGLSSAVHTSDTDTEADTDAEAEGHSVQEPPKTPPVLQGEKVPTKKLKAPQALTPLQIRLGSLFNRRDTTAWSAKELAALKAIAEPDPADLDKLEAYYRHKWPESADYRRRDLQTMLNNFSGELDRARKWKKPNCL